MRSQWGRGRKVLVPVPGAWGTLIAALIVRLVVAVPVWLFLLLALLAAGQLDIRPIDWPTAGRERTAQTVMLVGAAVLAVLCAWGLVSLAEQVDRPDTQRSRSSRTGILVVGATAQTALLLLTVFHDRGMEIDHLASLFAAAGTILTLAPLSEPVTTVADQQLLNADPDV